MRNRGHHALQLPAAAAARCCCCVCVRARRAGRRDDDDDGESDNSELRIPEDSAQRTALLIELASRNRKAQRRPTLSVQSCAAQ